MRVVGRLDTYVTRTGFEVTPVVGLRAPAASRWRSDASRSPRPSRCRWPIPRGAATGERHSRVYQGRERHFYAYPYGDRFIWGATAGMLSNLAEVLDAT